MWSPRWLQCQEVVSHPCNLPAWKWSFLWLSLAFCCGYLFEVSWLDLSESAFILKSRFSKCGMLFQVWDTADHSLQIQHLTFFFSLFDCCCVLARVMSLPSLPLFLPLGLFVSSQPPEMFLQQSFFKWPCCTSSMALSEHCLGFCLCPSPCICRATCPSERHPDSACHTLTDPLVAVSSWQQPLRVWLCRSGPSVIPTSSTLDFTNPKQCGSGILQIMRNSTDFPKSEFCRLTSLLWTKIAPASFFRHPPQSGTVLPFGKEVVRIEDLWTVTGVFEILAGVVCTRSCTQFWRFFQHCMFSCKNSSRSSQLVVKDWKLVL